MYGTFWALLPPIVAIVLALITKETYSSLFLGIVVGALFVGVGVGLVVRAGGASGGDDALALVISKVTGWPVSRAYLFTDVVVLALSLSYIPVKNIACSLVTVTLSSFIIGKIHTFGRR